MRCVVEETELESFSKRSKFALCCRVRADEDRRGVQGDTGAGDEYREYLFFFIRFFLVFRICRRCCWKFNRKIFSDNIFVPLTWPVFLFSFYFSFFFLERREGECNRILLSREVATRNLCGVSKEECSRLFWSRLFRSMDIS